MSNDKRQEEETEPEPKGKGNSRQYHRVLKRHLELASAILGIASVVPFAIASGLLSYHYTEPGIDCILVGSIALTLAAYLQIRHRFYQKKTLKRWPLILSAVLALCLVVRASRIVLFPTPEESKARDYPSVQTAFGIRRISAENSLVEVAVRFKNVGGGAAVNFNANADQGLIDARTGGRYGSGQCTPVGNCQTLTLAPGDETGILLPVYLYGALFGDWLLGRVYIQASGELRYYDSSKAEYGPERFCILALTDHTGSQQIVHCGTASIPPQNVPMPVPVPTAG